MLKFLSKGIVFIFNVIEYLFKGFKWFWILTFNKAKFMKFYRKRIFKQNVNLQNVTFILNVKKYLCQSKMET